MSRSTDMDLAWILKMLARPSRSGSSCHLSMHLTTSSRSAWQWYHIISPRLMPHSLSLSPYSVHRVRDMSLILCVIIGSSSIFDSPR